MSSAQGESLQAGVYYRPSSFEVATGWVHGRTKAQQLPPGGQHPIAALEESMLEALTSGRCCVAFSGGRDSSAILAVATRLARREGLPDPVPITELYPGDQDSEETYWQEIIIKHLGLNDWVRVVHRDGGLLGENAIESLRQRGLLFSEILHVKAPLFRAADAGWLFTGEGGDEVFRGRRIESIAHVVRTRDHRRKVLKAAARELRPSRLRALASRKHFIQVSRQPWLTPAAQDLCARLLAEAAASEPLAWPDAIRWLLTDRAAAVVRHNYSTMATDFGVKARHPFVQPQFISTLATWGPRLGLGRRTAVMRALFDDVLPAPLIERRSKADFTSAYMDSRIPAFADVWNGEGVDHDLVDPDALRSSWRSSLRNMLSGTALHAGWLAHHGLPADPAAAPRRHNVG